MAMIRARLIRGLNPRKPKPHVYRKVRYNAAELRFARWADQRSRPQAIRVQVLAERSGVSVQRILHLTEGAPFRLDFGRDRRGRLLTYFKVCGPQGLERWAQRLGVAS